MKKIMIYDLKVSNDFGVNYHIVESDVDLEIVKASAMHLPNESCRWVITDNKDDLIMWNHNVQGNVPTKDHIKQMKKNGKYSSVILATDDKYTAKLATAQGIKVLTQVQMLAMANGKSEKEIKDKIKNKQPLTKKDIKGALEEMDKMVNDGKIIVLENDFKGDKPFYKRQAK